MGHPDEAEWLHEAAMDEWFESRLSEEARAPVFLYLATYGDAIRERVAACHHEAQSLRVAGFSGAAVVRATAGLELVIRFYLVKPLVLGAFLSDQWAAALTSRIIRGRTADDRDLLPAILRVWKLDLTSVRLPDGAQAWETIVGSVWRSRNDYAHQGAIVSDQDADEALSCLDALIRHVVEPLALELGFTLRETGQWSVVLSAGDRRLNPPHVYEKKSPFERGAT